MESRRSDVDAMRCIGALLVAVFHIWIGGISGGVDVFFVLTGYFLTKKLTNKYEDNGKVTVFEVYKDFFYRVAPESLLTLLFILLIGLALFHPLNWSGFLNEYFASIFYVENYALIAKEADYLQRDESLSLVQHFWATSLIGQIYIIWPIIFFISISMSKRTNQKAWRLNYNILLIVVFSVSFAWSVFKTSSSPVSAYFDLTTRIWQFCAGGLVVSFQNLPTSKAIKSFGQLSWLGILMILTCGVIIGTRENFPGYASLWPVLGACLILIFGDQNRKGNASYWISAPALVKLSKLSFGIYLWHWPLVVAIYIFALSEVYLYLGILLSIILGFLSYHFIERIKFQNDFTHVLSYLKCKPIYCSGLLLSLIHI